MIAVVELRALYAHADVEWTSGTAERDGNVALHEGGSAGDWQQRLGGKERRIGRRSADFYIRLPREDPCRERGARFGHRPGDGVIHAAPFHLETSQQRPVRRLLPGTHRRTVSTRVHAMPRRALHELTP